MSANTFPGIAKCLKLLAFTFRDRILHSRLCKDIYSPHNLKSFLQPYHRQKISQEMSDGCKRSLQQEDQCSK